MKSDSSEMALAVGAILFWALALPLATIALAAAALCGRIGSLMPARKRRLFSCAAHLLPFTPWVDGNF